jgi:DNA mismatch repair protein MutS
MSFITDKQTLEDLSIFAKPGHDSIYNIFSNTFTRGGAGILEQMFLHPLSDVVSINERSRIFALFLIVNIPFPVSSELFDHTELYLGMTDSRTRMAMEDNTLKRKLGNLLSADGEAKNIRNGIVAVLEMVQQVLAFTAKLKVAAKGTPYSKELEEVSLLLADPDLLPLTTENVNGRHSYEVMAQLDNLIRFRNRKKIQQLVSYLYTLDVYMTVARIAAKRNFSLPVALDLEQHSLLIEGLYHPLLKTAIANDFSITPDSNIVFLTGANMAGKSTFMKSLGTAMFLAHMGFPVPAKRMEFAIRDGIFTTINLSDDLDLGSSHFYAEVLRVKKVARELGLNKSLFVIFDELFRGTNVKDAYEATIAITEAVAEKRNCMFVMSTHIIEAGDVLKERCSNINFIYLPTLMEGNIPRYAYTLKKGITSDRHGMIIINNEGILDILKSRKYKSTTT